MKIFVDHNRHIWLEYSLGKFLTMAGGKLDTATASKADQRSWKLYTKFDHIHLAKQWSGTFQPITQSARAILAQILGPDGNLRAVQRSSFSGLAVTGQRKSEDFVPLSEIAATLNQAPTDCRKILRKLEKKPGGRWEWDASEAERITNLLRGYFANP